MQMVKVVRNRSKIVSLFSVVLLSIPFSFVYWMNIWLEVCFDEISDSLSQREKGILTRPLNKLFRLQYKN